MNVGLLLLNEWRLVRVLLHREHAGGNGFVDSGRPYNSVALVYANWCSRVLLFKSHAVRKQ